jgi:hypothetical protein
MAQDPRYGFPAVSDGKPKPPKQGEPQVETVYEYEEGKNWKKGEWGPKIGTVRLEHVGDGDPPKKVEARFQFDNGETVTYEGDVPGNGSWVGKGRFHQQGSSRFPADLDVESVNPKRWG